MIRKVKIKKKEDSRFKKIWDFLWNSNSILSWIIDFILIFLLVKFVIFPLFGLMLGTSLPFVIIESGSMEHQGDFDSWFSLHGSWYLDKNISKEKVYSWDFNNGLDMGDIVIVRGNKNQDYEIGDIIIFSVPKQTTPIIHRIVGKTEHYYSTKGDHNDGQNYYEGMVFREQVIGKAALRIPKLGWFKLFLYGKFS